MKPFTVHKGIVAPLDRANIDTDQIIPKQFLKRIERTGFGEFLFYDWRFTADGKRDDLFILNQPGCENASILVTGKNFGCGSSREHAPWALAGWGFRAVIAPSFADIFANNSVKNSILPVVLSETQVAVLINRATETSGYEVTINLEEMSVSDGQGFSASFEIDSFKRHCLLNGLDDISLTLQYQDSIVEYENQRPAWSVIQNRER
jgi:3-isopropylmalate/(R)-2-methylmalate dehydratase small subunit